MPSRCCVGRVFFPALCPYTSSVMRSVLLLLLVIGAVGLSGCISTQPQMAVINIERESAASFTFKASPVGAVCSWAFGDGVQTRGNTVAHTYDEPGEYTVNLNVHTDNGTLSNHILVTAGRHWYVTMYGDLQATIESVTPGDTIFVEGDHGIIALDKDIEVAGMEIDGRGATLIRISYNHAGGLLRGFTITGDDNLQAMTLYHASPTIRDCEIRGNSISTYGAGVFATESSAAFERCEFIDNRSHVGGGAVYAFGWSSFPRFKECTFTGNRSDACGGAILIRSEKQSACAAMEIDRCVFTGNTAQGNLVGGAVHIGVGCEASICDCQFNGNRPLDVVRDECG